MPQEVMKADERAMRQEVTWDEKCEIAVKSRTILAPTSVEIVYTYSDTLSIRAPI